MIKLHRLFSNNVQTIDTLTIEYGGRLFATFATLELADKNNAPSVSRFPAGTYKVTKYNSAHNGKCFLVHDVPERDMIEIHSGNFHTQIKGCILVGLYHKDLNDDKELDVVSSRDAIDKLYNLLPDETTISIYDEI